MISPLRVRAGRLTTRALVPIVAAVAAGLLSSGRATAQPDSAAGDDLSEQIGRRYDVLVTAQALALRPKATERGVRWIEVTDQTITIDGLPVTGAELRERIGEDADLIIRLTYLDHETRRRLFSTAAAPAPVEAASPPPDVTRTRRSGERVQIGRGVRVDADEVITGDVVAVGGRAVILGEVRGSVVGVGGGVELGPNAVIRNDVTVVGGRLDRDPGARVGGEIHEVGFGWFPDIDWSRGSVFRDRRWSWAVGSAFALVSTLTRLAILCLLAAVVVLLGREHIEAVGARAATEPLKAGAIGLLSQLLFLPLLIVTIVVLVITIVGIPLLVLIPFAMLGLGLVGLVGFTAVAYRLGEVVSARFGWQGRGPYFTTFAGIALVLSPVLLARLVGLAGVPVVPMTFGLGFIGIVAEYLAWTIGFGAVALARFGGPVRVAPR
jgi:hypothetical protein